MSAQLVHSYSYTRISTKTKRQRKGDGIPRQLRLASEFSAKKGWILNTDFTLIDIGKSAYHGSNLDDNAALGTFINAIENDLIQRPAVLLVESLDRLSREKIPKALQLFLTILNHGVSICTHFDGQIYSEKSIQEDTYPILMAIFICHGRMKKAQPKLAEKKKAGRSPEKR